MSLDALRGSLRGPDGVRSRIAELQSRMAPGAFAESLGKAVADPPSAGPSPLFGTIASDGTVPMSPFAGVAVPSAGQAQLRALADGIARREGVDPKLLTAIVEAESGWDPTARSKAGALGLAQLMPDTARGLGVTSPLDPEQSLTGGAKYIKQMLAEFGGDVTKAVAAYNAGPGNVRKHGGVPPFAETQGYVKRVMARYGG